MSPISNESSNSEKDLNETDNGSSSQDGTSAKPAAEIKFLPFIRGGFDENNPKTVACSNCKTITTQFDTRIDAVDAGEAQSDPTDLMGRSRRISFCTNCAHIKVVK